VIGNAAPRRGKRSYRTLRIPEHVLERVHRRLSKVQIAAMLTTYRRHQKDCEHRGAGRKYRRCRCPIWVDGFLGGQEIRKSLETTDWQRAQDFVRTMEATDNEPTKTSDPIAIQFATEKFLADANARKLHESTIYKYRLLFKQIGDFGQKQGLRYLKELELTTLDDFRSEWKDGPRSSLKKLERLRAFLRFCERRKWIDGNPALDMKAPRVPIRPTMPFTQAEMLKILAAFEKYSARAGVANAQRLKAFVLLLRYSGMRIGDTVRCGIDRITGNKLFLYTQKTGVPVHSVLPDFAVRELEAAPKSSVGYFFWTGKSKLHSAIGKWQRRLQNLFSLAEIKGGHAHRFRDTFAVELLLAGIPLERVAVLLGHQSVRITERHYSPWVRSRQEQLEQDLMRVWEHDPVTLMETKGTPEVHGEGRQIN
jgi:integrase/recombinase XerD